jgi:hypothetical protein
MAKEAVLFTEMTPGARWEDEFNRWYDTEHRSSFGHWLERSSHPSSDHDANGHILLRLHRLNTTYRRRHEAQALHVIKMA